MSLNRLFPICFSTENLSLCVFLLCLYVFFIEESKVKTEGAGDRFELMEVQHNTHS